MKIFQYAHSDQNFPKTVGGSCRTPIVYKEKWIYPEAPIPQNSQTLSNNSSATANELFQSVFDHFVGGALKGLKIKTFQTKWSELKWFLYSPNTFSQTNCMDFSRRNECVILASWKVHRHKKFRVTFLNMYGRTCPVRCVIAQNCKRSHANTWWS